MSNETHLKILRLLENNPQMTQRELSIKLGVSLGKVNFCLKALKEKGYLKWQSFANNPNKLTYLYLLTPAGILEKTKLTAYFLKRKQAEFDALKLEIDSLIVEEMMQKSEYE
jgi:EPS-associated MarR family transcriptional regulator